MDPVRARTALRRNDLRSLVLKAGRQARWRASSFRSRHQRAEESVERAAASLRRAAAGVEDPAESVDLAMTFVSNGVRIWPWQIRSEILALIRILDRDPPRTILEIGTAEGGTLFVLTRVASADAQIVSIDLPGGAFGGGYSAVRVPLYESFAREGQRLKLIRADSHAPATVAEVNEFFAGEPLDLLFVDGDHTYEGVKADFELYSPLVRKGGRIVFHDIVPGRTPEETRRLVGGVPALWQDVARTHASLELVNDWKQIGLGIGVLTK